MYLFDLEDFKCDQLPDDWEDYGNSIRAIFDSTIKCLAELIETSDATEEIKQITYPQILSITEIIAT